MFLLLIGCCWVGGGRAVEAAVAAAAVGCCAEALAVGVALLKTAAGWLAGRGGPLSSSLSISSSIILSLPLVHLSVSFLPWLHYCGQCFALVMSGGGWKAELEERRREEERKTCQG
jgi:hypothetical protein